MTQRNYNRAAGTLTSIKTGTSAGGTTVQNLEMEYDRAANLIMRKDLGPDVNSGSGLWEQFTYDSLHRLIESVRHTIGSGVPGVNDAYAYDDFGNLKNKGAAYTGYAYLASRPHAVQAINAAGGTRSYSYDANGNVVSVVGGATAYVGTEWTVANLARKVSKASNHYTEFNYSPDRSRWRQVVQRPGGESETTHYVGALLEKRTKVNSGGTSVEHTHFVRAGNNVVALVRREKPAGGSATGLFAKYPHRDHLGSIVAVSSGGALERSGFDPWGKRVDFSSWVPPPPGSFSLGGTGSGGVVDAVISTNRGFTDHEQVEEFGFIHMNGRIYDPEIGRFLSADPTMQFPESTQGFNRFAYAGNNPLTNVDPSGFGFFKKLLKAAGIAAMFIPIPGVNAFTASLIKGFVSGFLSSGGKLRAGLMGGLTSSVGYGFGRGLDAIRGVKTLAANVAGGILASTSVAMAQGARAGAALMAAVRGAALGMAQHRVGEALGIGAMVREAMASATGNPGFRGVFRSAAAKSENGANSDSANKLFPVSDAGKAGVLRMTPNPALTPDQFEEIFETELAKLQAEGKIPKQNWLMRLLAPNFRPKGSYAVQVDAFRSARFDTLAAAEAYATQRGLKVVGGFTYGDTSEIYMTAALESEIPGVGHATPAETMRWVILHEYGHQDSGGGCGGGLGGELCADDYAKKRYK